MNEYSFHFKIIITLMAISCLKFSLSLTYRLLSQADVKNTSFLNYVQFLIENECT